MTHYRSYLLNELDTIFEGADLDVNLDEDAVAAAWVAHAAYNAEQVDQAIGIEVWSGRRMVFSSTLKMKRIAVADLAETAVAVVPCSTLAAPGQTLTQNEPGNDNGADNQHPQRQQRVQR